MAVKDTLTPLLLKNSLKTQNLITIAKKFSVSKQYITQLYAEYRAQYPDLFAEPEITAEWLSEQLEDHSILEICNMTGKSYHHIHKLMTQYGLSKNTATSHFDRDFIREQYVTHCNSDKELADYYGCSVSLIRKFRYEHSIFKTDRKPLSERVSKESLLELVQAGYSVMQLSEKFDVTQREMQKLLFSYGIEP